MGTRASQTKPTKFHHLLDDFARTDRLLCNLTQNIDCLEDKLPSLSSKTVQLHGRLDTLVCQRRSIHAFQVLPEDFQSRVMSPCPDCETVDKERVQMGKRSHGVGVLLPKILLYGAGPESVFGDRLLNEMFQKVDAVIIAGTRLQIKAAKTLAAELCRAAKGRNGLTVWVNKERPPREFESVLDYVTLGDCDEFASLISA
jgi:NAD-dependent SIR2 family protein deacetylase